MNSRIYRTVARCSTLTLKKYGKQILSGPSVFHTTNNVQFRCLCSRTSQELSNLIDCPVESDEFVMEQDSYLNVDFESIAEGDPENIKQLKIMQLEIHMMRQQGEKVPSRLTNSQWCDLLKISKEPLQRQRYLAYLWLNETKTLHRKEKQAENNKLWAIKKEEMRKQEPITFTTSSPMMYGLKYMTLFHRIYDTQINRLFNYNLLLAEWFGTCILIDCGYEPYMKHKDVSNCVKQLLLSWSGNRDHLDPFNIILCNVDPKGMIVEKLRNLFPCLDEPDFPFNITSKNYLDLYPRNKLVYLTPHSKDVLYEYNPDDIYIIGKLSKLYTFQ